MNVSVRASTWNFLFCSHGKACNDVQRFKVVREVYELKFKSSKFAVFEQRLQATAEGRKVQLTTPPEEY